MKKTLLALLCGGILLTSQAVSAKNVVIGAPMVAFSDKWQTYLQDAIREFDKTHDDVVIKLADANGDPARLLMMRRLSLIKKLMHYLLFRPIRIL